MKEQLIRYVDLLFAGAPEAVDIKQEILQNSLDRYDDLINQGKTPEAAYSLAISGIGDISELLGNPQVHSPATPAVTSAVREKPMWKKVLCAVGVLLYIICPIPLFVLAGLGMDTLGLCGMLAIVAVATALMILSAGKQNTKKADSTDSAEPLTPQQELRKAVHSGIWTVGLVVYLVLSFLTQAWYITWVIFPMIAAVQGIATAILDLKEASKK